jgi:NitT/TauT family transport system substrate-binding protein
MVRILAGHGTHFPEQAYFIFISDLIRNENKGLSRHTLSPFLTKNRASIANMLADTSPEPHTMEQQMPSCNSRAASLVTAAFLFLAVGCSAGSGSNVAFTSPSALEEPDITIAAVPSVDLAGVYIAEDDGFFAQQGLHVKLVTIAASKVIVDDQLAGKIDLCAGAYMPYISAQAAGARFHILAEGSIMTPDTRVLLTPPNSGLTSVAQLAGKTIGMNATNSIGTLLVSAMLQQNGVSPKSVHFITDSSGFPTMAKELSKGAWDAAFFGEPYSTQAQEAYGDVVLTDLDKGAATNLPISGYIATQAWVSKHPRTAAAFVRAIEAAQELADTDPAAVQAAMATSDHLSRLVTDVMAVPDFPTGPVDTTRIQREALDMVQFGLIKSRYYAAVRQGTVVESMVNPGG